jgi:hypothetical protein
LGGHCEDAIYLFLITDHITWKTDIAVPALRLTNVTGHIAFYGSKTRHACTIRVDDITCRQTVCMTGMLVMMKTGMQKTAV